VSEQDKDQQTNGEPRQGDELLDEAERLGSAVGEAIDEAWNSEDRKQLTDDLGGELRLAGEEIGKLVKDVASSEAAREIRDELKIAGKQVGQIARNAASTRTAESLREGTERLGKELHGGLMSGLKFLNRELSRKPGERASDGESSDD
jgi:hypothetical protein